ncbi:GNAT family N-acetyltransferase [Gracilibacillus alcaliphilus]|uniref:GNAT family N-acetyltransferase n=1 Tax=Gracilibacillus alcaliphilus TaxID=1401441 RepID=UPI00195C21AA|nr:GNAT family N-acetyltransferase [Gracilibacillus alcaliphilus]MBM7676273.1 diamine N-acetyltransferase [Gracilibacillus alcaliphilus]
MGEMLISLIPIDKHNKEQCVNLKPRRDQEELVATNSNSLVHATKEPTTVPHGIYANDQMVGFILFDNQMYNDGYYWILRFMIDQRYQGNGYGKSAILEVIKQLEAKSDCKEIRVSHVPHNKAANGLYKSLGFEETGEMEDGETVLSYVIRH